MLMEVMVAHIDVLGLWAKFWQTCHFECSRTVLKDLAVHMWLCADHLKAMFFHLLSQLHDGDDILERHG